MKAAQDSGEGPGVPVSCGCRKIIVGHGKHEHRQDSGGDQSLVWHENRRDPGAAFGE